MSYQKQIENKLREIAQFNQIPIKEIIVSEKIVTIERHYKKERVYEVKIIFSNVKTPLDYLFVFYYYFILRFKVYRCFYNNEDNSLNYHLKKRNMTAVKSIFED